MEYRRMGRSGLKVSEVCLGTMTFGRGADETESGRMVAAAMDAGVNFIDTADGYNNGLAETMLGNILKGRRREAVIATKFFNPMGSGPNDSGMSRLHIKNAVEDSLRRLRTDYIDLYQLHQPDPNVPIVDTLGALDDLVKAGKVKQIGCSNFSADQMDEAHRAAAPGAARFVSVQNELSLLHREPEREVLPACTRLGLAFLPYFPLASGLLTGKYKRGRGAPEGSRLSLSWTARFTAPKNVAIAEALANYASARGHTLLELAFSWLAAHGQLASVIAGATSPEQVRANAAAVDWRLRPEDLAEIDRLAPPS